jgi:hypothetical protein
VTPLDFTESSALFDAYGSELIVNWIDGEFECVSASILDTGPGTYPSIAGIHKGTITPNRTISVSTLYTYPCPGTGGHTEYVRIYGNGLDRSASWGGYNGGDWQNITFSMNFTLGAGKTYNYEIRTGSYPQMHHTDELELPSGRITCTEFVDVNGKRHEKWIPAIRLS